MNSQGTRRSEKWHNTVTYQNWLGKVLRFSPESVSTSFVLYGSIVNFASLSCYRKNAANFPNCHHGCSCCELTGICGLYHIKAYLCSRSRSNHRILSRLKVFTFFHFSFKFVIQYISVTSRLHNTHTVPVVKTALILNLQHISSIQW